MCFTRTYVIYLQHTNIIWPQKSTVTHLSDFLAVILFCFVFLTTKSAAEDYTKNTGQVEERRGCDWGGGGGPPEC